MDSMLATQEKILDQLGRIETELKRVAFEVDMNRTEIYEFFPLQNNKRLHEFLSVSHGNFKEKRHQFEYMLYNAATKHRSHQTQFGEALKNLLFTREYVCIHRWPNAR